MSSSTGQATVELCEVLLRVLFAVCESGLLQPRLLYSYYLQLLCYLRTPRKNQQSCYLFADSCKIRGKSLVCLFHASCMHICARVIFTAPRLLCDTFSSLQPIAKLLQVSYNSYAVLLDFVTLLALQVDSDRLYSRTIRNSVEKMLHDNKQPLGHQDFCNVSSLLLQIRNPRTALATGRWAAMQFETGWYATHFNTQDTAEK